MTFVHHPNTNGQLRDILPDMESNDIDDQVRNTQSDVEPIDIEYLLEDNQRVVNFLTAGTQEDKQRFIDLLNAKIDREWEARKAVSQARRTPRRPDIYAYVQANEQRLFAIRSITKTLPPVERSRGRVKQYKAGQAYRRTAPSTSSCVLCVWCLVINTV